MTTTAFRERYAPPLTLAACALTFVLATVLTVALYLQHTRELPVREWWLLYVVGLVAPLTNTLVALRRARSLQREFPTLPAKVASELRDSAVRPVVIGYAVMVFALLVIRRLL